MSYSIRHIASLVNGTWLQAGEEAQIENLLTDSRRLVFPESTLFFALPGPRRSGQQFLPELFQRGVRNFIVEEEVDLTLYPGANIIRVANALSALQTLAAFHRSRFEYPVIGITGSNGKTIVKEWLNQLLEDKFRIVRSPRSFNSQTGVPLSVWQMNDSYNLALIEAGISEKGEMAALQRIIRPEFGVFTNIGEAHDEGFKDRTEKIQEKLQLFEESRLLMYPADDAALHEVISSWSRIHPEVKLFSFGKSGSALRLISEKRNEGSTELQLEYEKQIFSLTIGFADDASVQNVLTCIAVLLNLNISTDEFSSRFLRLSPISMRMELQTGINHCSVINDSYSADISSLRIALDFLSRQRQHLKRTVILSDILQSGQRPELLYGEVARLLRQFQVDRLIGIGEEISANRKLFDIQEQAFHASTASFLESFHARAFHDEAILIKGARVFGFERIDRLLSQQVHETLLELNLEAMAHNLKAYHGLLRAATRIMAMVKAFSYGSGGFEIARALEFHKVDYLAVAYADEGSSLRTQGIRLPIVVMNTEESALDALVEYQLEPVIYSFRILQAVEKYIRNEGLTAFPVHLELETGMNRLGFSEPDIPRLNGMLRHTALQVRSVFSHLAASEDAQQDEFTERQFQRYREMSAQLQEAVPRPFLRHIANSAAVVRNPGLQLDMVRIGIGLYGIDPANSHQLDLRPVGTLKTTIAQIKSIHSGETIGYNRRGLADRPLKIATVRLGYADGYPRSLGNGVGKMLYRGQLVPTIGNLCMDMSMIDITSIDNAREGDELLVFGPGLPVEQVARWAGTIPYELLAGISQRVKRVYYE
ncbi:MAG TPA: bifunctional UDP-N-acetylmuramoyl-tripeptide:D-alanyl-D-alanine ligase/alanine racemase [Puia sp.]|nr:bifunctional UDP-N-acetylmuramoyl-tripeptide:D-alanyl-D-alanine ligase/alanine racemase [Puia sp.]